MADSKNITFENSVQIVADIVSAYVRYNPVSAEALPELIRKIHTTLTTLEKIPGNGIDPGHRPAVSIRRSIQPDYIICLEDGKKLKMLKRYLRTQYGLTPEQYRHKWNLPSDYPMVAPNYSKQRSNFAKAIGLGQKARLE